MNVLLQNVISIFYKGEHEKLFAQPQGFMEHCLENMALGLVKVTDLVHHNNVRHCTLYEVHSAQTEFQEYELLTPLGD
jgi:hypothetical protein